MSDILERLKRLEEKFVEPAFLTNKGLSNEVGIYVFAYSPKDELVVRDFVKHVSRKKDKFNIVEKDLYEILLTICDEKKITKAIPTMEEKKGKAYIETQLRNVATVESFISKMEYEPHNYGDILLITGVGKVYPFMRTHSLLESIQDHFQDMPIVVLYPGEYDGQKLVLFDKFFDDNHYRSFNIV